MNQMARPAQTAIDRVGQIAGLLLHPRAARLRGSRHGDLSSITKKTRYRLSPASVNTSTVNRSQAARPSQCARRACAGSARAPGRLRGRAGSASPWSGRRVAVRERAADPRVAPPRIVDRHPDHEFGDVLSGHWSTRRRRALPSYFLAISLRYQRRIVSGVTMPATCVKTRRPSL